MSENRNQLRDRALKATPGPWQHERLGIIQGGPMQTYVNGAAMPQLFTSHGADFMEPGEYLANADFVASANPAAVLAMLDEIDRLKADNAALEKRLCICQECGGRGEVPTGEYTYEGQWQPPEPVMVECGECGGDGQIGGIQDLDAVIIERDQLKVENARWQKNYEHLIEQHMPRTGHGCEEGWSRVVEARELQAENAELRRDAERYRWLRESKNTEGPSMVSVYATGELDSAIDRMISKEQP